MTREAPAELFASSRAWVLIDGFNYFHAIKDAVYRGFARQSIKWLDYQGLAQTVVEKDSPGAKLASVRWYTAYVKNDPQARDRHSWYRKALEARGVMTVEGEYKRTTRRCTNCRATIDAWEEKATDVNIAIDIVSGAASNDYDTLYLFSGDSDLTPAVDRARTSFKKNVVVVVPGWRVNQDGKPIGFHSLSSVATRVIRLVVTDIGGAQLPDEVPLPSGKTARRPAKWR